MGCVKGRVDLIRDGLDMYFVPNGRTDDREIPRVRSIVDYVARRLAIDWLPYDRRCELGVYTVDERMAQVRAWMSVEDVRLSNPYHRGCPDAFEWDVANSIDDPAAAACMVLVGPTTSSAAAPHELHAVRWWRA
jgi:hypothetical protein